MPKVHKPFGVRAGNGEVDIGKFIDQFHHLGIIEGIYVKFVGKEVPDLGDYLQSRSSPRSDNAQGKRDIHSC